MTRNKDAVLTAAKGYVYFAPVGTAAPTPSAIASFDPETGFTGGTWKESGHTSRDDLPEFGFDGGDTSVKGSWQNAVLREVVTQAASDYVTINLLQFDDTALGLYYGVTDPGSTAGVFAVKDAPTNTVSKAVLVVIVDGGVSIGFHAPEASVRRDDSISMAVDEFAALPIRATFVKNESAAYLFAWISSETGVNPGS